MTNFRDYSEKYLSEILPPEFDRSFLSDGVTADFGRNISENNGSYLTEYGMLSSAGGQIYAMIETEETQRQGLTMKRKEIPDDYEAALKTALTDGNI